MRGRHLGDYPPGGRPRLPGRLLRSAASLEIQGRKPQTFLLTGGSPSRSFFDSRLPTTFFREERVGTGYFVLFEKLSLDVGALWVRFFRRSLLASDFAARRTTAHVAQSVEHLHGKKRSAVRFRSWAPLSASRTVEFR